MRIRAVSFDLDDTLVERSYVDYFWLDLLPLLYAEQNDLDLEEAKRRVYAYYDYVGQEDLRWYLPSYWFKRLGIEVELEEILQELKPLVRPYDDALKVIELLGSSYMLAILTNAAMEFVYVVLDAVPLFKNSFKVILSCVTNFALPRKNERFYRLALKVMGLSPSELVHVGDDLLYDREVPRRSGVRAFQIDRSGKMGDISTLLELPGLLRRLGGSFKNSDA